MKQLAGLALPAAVKWHVRGLGRTRFRDFDARPKPRACHPTDGYRADPHNKDIPYDRTAANARNRTVTDRRAEPALLCYLPSRILRYTGQRADDEEVGRGVDRPGYPERVTCPGGRVAMTANGEEITSDKRKRKLKIMVAATAAVLLVGLTLVFFILRGQRFVVELTQAQLQEKLDARFPIAKPYLLVLVLTYSEPEVTLTEGSDRVSFGVKATLNILIGGQPKPLGGHGIVSTGVQYNPEDYSFYLNDPRLEQLDIQGVPIKYTAIVNDLAKQMLEERINRTPIYTLKETDLKQEAARLILKGLTVHDGKLVITLGI